MTKTSLPVVLLNGVILLPGNDIRLEFDKEDSNNIIEIAELFHNNRVLIVNSAFKLDKTPKASDLPLLGIIAHISNKIDLPNGKTRIFLRGIKRAKVLEYLNLDNNVSLEGVVEEITTEISDIEYAEVLLKKIYRELEEYVNMVPYVNNGILEFSENDLSLTEITDVVVSSLPINTKRLLEYLNTLDPIKRGEMLLTDLSYEKQVSNIEKQIDNKVTSEINKSQKEYLLREKIKAIKNELGDYEKEADEIRLTINKINAPEKIKKRLNKELQKLESMNSNSPEINIVSNYIDWLISLPWSKETDDNDDLKSVLESLNKSHYGLKDVKTRIIEFLAVKKMTNFLKAPIICLVGSPGVGKTSLAFSIAHAINRNFVKISVGGLDDEAEIMGHRKTYLGANPGKIIQGMKKAGSINPVFLIDEIDKMTKSIKGDPASALLEILDPEQNKYFSDNFIEEEYDLSKVMFIATANNINDIPSPLQDRLEIINLDSYTLYEKLDIAKKHLIPKLCKEHGLEEKYISIDDSIILTLIESYTREAGVRELERKLATIIRKVVTDIVLGNDKIHKYNIDKKKIIKYLGNPIYQKNYNIVNDSGIVNGLAYTNYGGDVLPIEVNYYKGNGKLILTGSLGNVIKESADIALSYVKAHSKSFNIKEDLFKENDIHVHLPEGAIPKDGPSAGIALTSALISALSKTKVRASIAMTGEITLRGNVLQIGGLKEKSLGAVRSGIKTIIIPKDNERDLDEIPKEIKSQLNYILVKNYKEVYKCLQDINKES